MSTEILEIPAETDKLSPINKAKEAIERIRNKAAALTIADHNDKKGFEAVYQTRQEAARLRVDVEKTRKALVEDSVKWQRLVNSTANPLESDLKEIEAGLKAKEDAFVAEKQRIKDEVERKRKERNLKRIAVITSLDSRFNGSGYTLGKQFVSQEEIETLSDDDFQTKVEVFEAEYQIILEERLATEKAEQEEKRKTERHNKVYGLGLILDGESFVKDDFTITNAELLSDDDETFNGKILAISKEMKRRSDETAEKLKQFEADQKKLKEDQAKLKVDTRRAQMIALCGVESDFSFIYKDRVLCTRNEFHNLSDEEWSDKLSGLPDAIADYEKELKDQEEEKNRKAAELLDRQSKIAKLGFMPNQHKGFIYNKDLSISISEIEQLTGPGFNKKLEELEAGVKLAIDTEKRIADEKEAKKLAKRPDIEKFNDMTAQVAAIVEKFSFKTEEGKNAYSDFKTGIELLVKTCMLKAE